MIFFPEIECPDRDNGSWWVYILQSNDGALYIGQTLDLQERLGKHHFGLASKHTHDHCNPRLVHMERFSNLTAAVKRERQLKGWSRLKKEALIRGDFSSLSKLSQSRE